MRYSLCVDLPYDKSAIDDLCSSLHEYIGWVRIDFFHLLRNGMELITYLKSNGMHPILDFELLYSQYGLRDTVIPFFVDIENNCKSDINNGCAITFSSFSNKNVYELFKLAANSKKLGMMIICKLTSEYNKIDLKEMGFSDYSYDLFIYKQLNRINENYIDGIMINYLQYEELKYWIDNKEFPTERLFIDTGYIDYDTFVERAKIILRNDKILILSKNFSEIPNQEKFILDLCTDVAK